MPIQAPQWTDYLNCPVCCREFGAPPRSPISLGCGHTLCRHCLNHLHRKQCPFDQTTIQVEPEELVVNTALLQLAGYAPPAQPYHPPCIQALPEPDRQAYDAIVRCCEYLAVYLKYCGNANSSVSGNRLSRPMQRKLVTLLQCALTDEEGRGRAARAARSLGERTVIELILQHQNPQQLSANLWAAVRARGCQFLGPAMQEEVLKLVLLALEDGSALSRKVLVMFVVQRLEPHFPQASKTSIGHVVQLLYRASCFKVSKRECDSSLMQLKEEFRTYESLRREHDAQIVQIATEAGLRIAPDQWSALLYGDTAHKSHMQSIIDKLQTPQSFAQSVQELFIALQRTGDPAQLVVMSIHLDRLACIDASPDSRSPSWQQLAEIMTSLKEVVSGLVHFQQHTGGRDSNHNQKHNTQERTNEASTSQVPAQTTMSPPTHCKYKVSMCRDAATRSFCPRGNACTFAHSEEELERYRAIMCTGSAPGGGGAGGGTAGGVTNGNYMYMANVGGAMPLPPPPMANVPMPQHMYPPPFPMHPPIDNYNVRPPMATMPPQPQPLPPDMVDQHNMENNYPTSSQIIIRRPVIPMQNGYMMMPDRPYYGRFSNMFPIQEEDVQYSPRSPPYPPTGSPPYRSLSPSYGPRSPLDRPYSPRTPPYPRSPAYAPEYTPVYQGPISAGPMYQQNPEQNLAPIPNIFVTVPNENFEETFDDLDAEYRVPPTYVPVQRERRHDPPWPPSNDVFNFDTMRNTLPHCSSSSEDMFNVSNDRRVVGVDRLGTVSDRMAARGSTYLSHRADDKELEEELQELERRIDTEFENAD